MAWFCRLLCYAFFGLALVAAGGDGLRSLEEGQFTFRSFGDAWINLDESTATGFQALVRDWLPSVFDPVMNAPSWVVLALIAVFFWLLALLFQRRRPRRRFY